MSLQIHRLGRYHKMTAKSVLRPEALPPIDGAEKKHVLRSYLQFHDWLILGSMTLPPAQFGWKLDESGRFSPFMTTVPIAPPELLKMTACNCKKDCTTLKCSCKRIGVKGITACGTFNGKNCSSIEFE